MLVMEKCIAHLSPSPSFSFLAKAPIVHAYKHHGYAYKRCSCVCRAHGFSLLEVLIALFILAFSLSALANFVTTAWRRTYDAYFISLGVASAANRADAAFAKDDGQYHVLWQQSVAQILPKGRAIYDGKSSIFHAAVCWQQLFRRTNFCYQLDP